jgi:IclR family acetate operon transcriptional repressor
VISRSAPPGGQAVVRAVGLLKVVGGAGAGRLTDLARATGLHKATARRLLVALEREGMVARDRDGDLYRLGPEALALGARAGDLRALCRPELEALAAATGETATLEVLIGGEVLILVEAQPPGRIGASAELGSRWPAHTTSTGKAILAHLPAAEVRAILGPRLERRTPRTVTTRAALERELARVRGTGYAVAAEELERGYTAVGAAVMDRDGRPAGAISVGGPSGRLGPRVVAGAGQAVAAAAARISRGLGHRSGEASR